MNNFPDWMAQYQNYNQAQNMFNFLQNQQNMPNQFIGIQGGANNQDQKINLCFATIQGSRIMMKINPEDTVEQVLEKYLLIWQNLNYYLYKLYILSISLTKLNNISFSIL